MAAYTFWVILGVVVRVHMKTIVPYVDCFMWSKSKSVLFRTICPNTLLFGSMYFASLCVRLVVFSIHSFIRTFLFILVILHHFGVVTYICL